jgi:hypothetical protein
MPGSSGCQDQADDRLLGQRAGIPGVPIAFYLPPHAAHRIPRLREGRLLLDSHPLENAALSRRTPEAALRDNCAGRPKWVEPTIVDYRRMALLRRIPPFAGRQRRNKRGSECGQFGRSLA